MSHCIGIADEEFIRGRVPMTKEEVRVVTLSKAKLHPEAVVLDVGAGTGSLSIEAALLAERGHVYAIERNAEGVALIRQNAAKFAAKNLTIIESDAPNGMEALPPCDAIFVGGSGSHLGGILERAAQLLKKGGHLVINSVTVETLYRAVEFMKAADIFEYEIVQIQASRFRSIGGYHLAQAMNPVSIVTGRKK